MKEIKGGIFAPTDVKLIKEAIAFYLKHSGDLSESEERQAANLLHRLNSRT